VCIFRLFRVSNLREHHTKAVFDLNLMVGGGEHKVVLDESGFRAYCVDVDWGLNFQIILITPLLFSDLGLTSSSFPKDSQASFTYVSRLLSSVGSI